jgi:hypothetical protein
MTNQKAEALGRKSELGLHIQICGQCAEPFLTDDKRRTLCSEKCQKLRRLKQDAKNQAAHRTAHAVRVLCRQTLKNAVLLGKVRRPERCEACGSVVTDGVVEAHHEDYTRPFFVEWLCKSCHEGVPDTGASWPEAVSA